jgi:membrane fusion protein (multidrug efflux system)
LPYARVSFRHEEFGMRYVLVIIALVLIIGGLGGIKATQIKSLIDFGQTMQKAGPPPEAVNTRPAEQQSWEGVLTAVATVVTEQGVTLSNDSPGVVSKLFFESGQNVKRGQPLVELDASVERAQLASLIARQKLFQQSLDRSKKLLPTGAIPQAQFDADESAYEGVRADINAIQAQIERKLVRAPFSGRVGLRGVNLGQYLAPGTPISVIDSSDSVYVDFTLPQQELPDLKVGLATRIYLRSGGEPIAEGVLAAVEPSIDAATRAVKLRANVKNKGGVLRPGMFVNVQVALPQRQAVTVVPATAIIHAPYGDSLFIVEPKLDEAGKPVLGQDGQPVKAARQQFVRLGSMRGDFVSVVNGVKAGQEVVVVGAFKLRNGASVVVKDEKIIDPKLNPQVENK